MVGWKAFESFACNVTTRTKDEANKWNQVEKQGQKERELKKRKKSKLTKLYIIIYIESKSTKTILTTHYEKVKNQIKFRSEVTKDNHSKNLKKTLRNTMPF